MSHPNAAWRWTVTAGMLAFFCIFSFGTAKLRARIHQERRQALVTLDNGDGRALLPGLSASVTMVIAPAAKPVEALPQVGRASAEPENLPPHPALPRTRPLRGPPLAA